MQTNYTRLLKGCIFSALASGLMNQTAIANGVVADCSEASLRAALTGGGVVTYSNDCSVIIAGQITINQAATTIDANGHNVSIGSSNGVSLFDVATNLTLRGLSLLNGTSTNGGGALYIRQGAVVIATSCIFAGNAAIGTNGLAGANGATNSLSAGGNGSDGTPGVSAFGGAIYNLGSLTLVNCTLTNNAASGGNGGAGGVGGQGGGTFEIGGNGGNGAPGGLGLGGAVYNLGDLTLIDCTFSANTANGGSGGTGGAGGAGSRPGLPGSGAAGASGAGGAVFNGGNLTLLASTFSTSSAHGGNSAAAGIHGNGTGMTGNKGGQGSGGAIFNNWWAVVTNCTFYTNTVFGGTGGNGGNGDAIFAIPGNGGDGGDGLGGAVENANTITLVNCTLFGNDGFGGTNGLAGSGSYPASNGAIGGADGGDVAITGGVLTLMNSIVAGSVSASNTFGAFTDAGYNLSSGSSSSFGPTSLQKTDPKLGPLAANGGLTLTMALLTNSPAIGKIPAGQSPPTDQRGFPRPVNGPTDIGAYEFATTGTVSQVQLSINRTSSNHFQINGTGTVGLTYMVQASTNLLSWQTISTNLAPIQFLDPATNLPARFYRISR